MVRLYKYFSFTRETKKHINLQETVYRPARVIELVSLLKMKQHVIITVSDTSTISQSPENANIYEWLEESMRNLHRQLCSRGDPNDFIGLTISSEKFNHGLLWLSFRPVKNLKPDDIWELLFNTVQSAGDFNIDDKLSTVPL